MAGFNLRIQNYRSRYYVLGLKIYMLPYWFFYQNKRFKESYWPAYKKSRDKKRKIIIFCELIKLFMKWRCIPYHYFRYQLYEKTPHRNIYLYIPETIVYYSILPRINKEEFLLDNKNIFEEILKGQEILYPKTILKISRGIIFDDKNCFVYKKGISDLLQKIKTEYLFCKPANCGSGGKDIIVFHKKNKTFEDARGVALDWEYLSNLLHSDWIFQEQVINCKELNEIHPKSVNSFRVMTFFTKKYGARTVYCILKVGNNNSLTDNAHTGGIYVNIDISTGELDEIAYDENLNKFTKHPLTGYSFYGKRIGRIKEVVEVAEKLGNIFTNLTFIGWDIALTDDGPMVLEGNSSPGLTIIQRTQFGMEKFIELVNEK